MSVDYRLKENRKQAFVKWMVWSMLYEDCDPSLFMTNYLFDRFEVNSEQRLWLCWLYGTTYYLPTAWVIFNEFPDFELVDQKRLEDWNNANYKRLRYQTDTKYNKGHLPAQFASYRAWIHSTAKTQREKFKQLTTNKCPEKNYQLVFDEITGNLHKFGRYTAWFYIQTLKHCAKINVDAPNLILEDFSGSKSHRNGLCYATGHDEWVNQKLTKEQTNVLNVEAAKMLKEVNLYMMQLDFTEQADYFAMETCLCSFKKLFRKSRGRYLGYYLDRQAEEIAKVEQDGWSGICWKPLWDARNETIKRPELLGGNVVPERMVHFLDNGSLERLDYLWPEDKTSTETLSFDLTKFSV
jgi:hypothetical protein